MSQRIFARVRLSQAVSVCVDSECPKNPRSSENSSKVEGTFCAKRFTKELLPYMNRQLYKASQFSRFARFSLPADRERPRQGSPIINLFQKGQRKRPVLDFHMSYFEHGPLLNLRPPKARACPTCSQKSTTAIIYILLKR